MDYLKFDGHSDKGLREKSKSIVKEDKGKFFHIDLFMMMGAKSLCQFIKIERKNMKKLD